MVLPITLAVMPKKKDHHHHSSNYSNIGVAGKYTKKESPPNLPSKHFIRKKILKMKLMVLFQISLFYFFFFK